MHGLAELLERISGLDTSSEPLDPKEAEQRKVDDWNNSEGTLHEEDGYNCPICKNRGDIAQLMEYPPGCWQHKFRVCKCMTTRASIRRMNESGLGNVIRDCTFERYETPEPWQQTIKARAMEYAGEKRGWLYMGGQSGAGKSHLCTAVCREFLLSGKAVAYMMWADDAAKLKAVSLDAEERERMMERFKKTEVLYIDDLFKPARDGMNQKQRPTAADVKLAFEILNYRYMDPKLLTIISSEWSQDELLDIDEATGGRIFQKAGKYGISISEDRKRNYRTRNAVTL